MTIMSPLGIPFKELTMSIEQLESQIKASEKYIQELKRKHCGAKATIVKHETKIRNLKRQLKCLNTKVQN